MGGVSSFNATFQRRIHRWLEQISAGAARDEIEGSGAEGLAAQEVIEAAIHSFQTGTVVEVANG